jgi:hypothetical protein
MTKFIGRAFFNGGSLWALNWTTMSATIEDD